MCIDIVEVWFGIANHHCLQRQDVSGFCRTRVKEELSVIMLGSFFQFSIKICGYSLEVSY